MILVDRPDPRAEASRRRLAGQGQRQGRRIVAARPELHRRQGQPDHEVLPDPAVGRRRRLRPDCQRVAATSGPRASSTRCLTRATARTPASRACSRRCARAASPSASSKASTASGPTARATASARCCPSSTTRADRARSRASWREPGVPGHAVHLDVRRRRGHVRDVRRRLPHRQDRARPRTRQG